MNRIQAARRFSAGAAALFLSAGAIGVTTSSAKAANPDDFDLTAAASALDIHIQDNSLPVTQVLDASPFGSSASLSSSGVVKADAGAPYAPFVYSLPRTSTGLGSGNLPPIPSAPGYVAATYPVVPVATQKTGGYELTAGTSQSAARGEVKLGSQPAGSANSTGFAISEARANDDGTVFAGGAAGIDLLSFGGVLDLARVSSALGITVPSSGKPQFSDSTDLGTVTFATNFTSGAKNGTTFLAGQPVPLSVDTLQAVNQYARPYGLVLTYLPQTFSYSDGSSSQGPEPDPNKTVRSVVSGGLQITSDNKVPTQGQVTTRYTLGRVSLSATNIALPVAASGPGAVPGGGALPLTGTGTGPGADTATGTAGGPVSAAQGPDPAGVTPAAVNDGATPATAAGSGRPSVTLTPRTHPVAYTGQAATSSQSVYLMLAIGSAAALTGVQLIRFFAVKA